MHLLHHVIKGVREFGPVYGTWMFAFERFNGWCARRALNKRHPEATIVETYLVNQLFTYYIVCTGIGGIFFSLISLINLDVLNPCVFISCHMCPINFHQSSIDQYKFTATGVILDVFSVR